MNSASAFIFQFFAHPLAFSSENIVFCFYRQHYRTQHLKLSFTDVLRAANVKVLLLSFCIFAYMQRKYFRPTYFSVRLLFFSHQTDLDELLRDNSLDTGNWHWFYRCSAGSLFFFCRPDSFLAGSSAKMEDVHQHPGACCHLFHWFITQTSTAVQAKLWEQPHSRIGSGAQGHWKSAQATLPCIKQFLSIHVSPRRRVSGSFNIIGTLPSVFFSYQRVASHLYH